MLRKYFSVFGYEDIWSSMDLLLHINLLIFDIRESSPIHITFPQIIIKHTCKTISLPPMSTFYPQIVHFWSSLVVSSHFWVEMVRNQPHFLLYLLGTIGNKVISFGLSKKWELTKVISTSSGSMISKAACYRGGPGYESRQGREWLILNKKEFLIWIWIGTWHFTHPIGPILEDRYV